MNEKYMKKRADSTKQKTNSLGLDLSAEWAGFVNFEWTDALKEQYGFWVLEFNFWDELNLQAARGRRISVQFDLYHQCYVASVFERDAKSVNAGKLVTARGQDSATAISRLLFLLSNALREGWGTTKKSSTEDKW
jgi:hypothetical protein